MSRISDFFLGLRHLGKGFGFLSKHPSLWPWVIIPVIISILILALSWGLFVHYYPDFYQLLSNHIGLQNLPEAKGFWGSLSFAGLWVVKQLLKVLLFMLGLILASILTFLVYLIIASPFFDLLAERVTTLSQGIEPPPFQWGRFFKSIGRTITVEAQKAGLFLIVAATLLVLNLIPWFGGILYVTLTGLFGMWSLGFFSVDFPMGHQLLGFKQRLRFALSFKYALAGFGIFFLIPFAPLLLQAPMVVGGTLLYHNLSKQNP
ncbi:MAG: hypothetical protein A3F82_00880 [Deltaproteobacteria bacterium RIFCSPLOWO2_12_FULL_44_12]|nr:MAG: hypothetical protein A2712_04075 [Deltaproteobacteria bacterium RIFCSPHIGHO2_01_FULL_43_49]OGQ16362.1 MAG: hypothetical protein A3D22_02045 [Deltaproteobacteria bacterium RIFCSPHIGHO2_02_FULL_44_53]OGQ27812.1 MAG: hypothetical protein A3D98_08945 [Deltaproteobacteria bacterium RIFCSPHIGHO2_12_FULL_44_21]OGQ32880.1 MAG: hypothetical protein A2979_09975 [Deltaproteobacteria bacterium RIFCSPLOWO2_01_FULL_45_74]OGQ41981.1 MAG: hypothetical protein A3I70_09760 [Deltaproteobacteria bacterium 